MKHKGCGGDIALDVTELYMLLSPSLAISPNGVKPGMVEIFACEKNGKVKLICQKCQQEFSSKESFENEIEAECGVCGHSFSSGKIRVTDQISLLCEKCLGGETKDIDSRQRKLLSLYGGVLKSGNYPTLLTVLMKKL